MSFFIRRITPRLEHVSALVPQLQRLAPVPYLDDDGEPAPVAEIQIVLEPYDGPIVVMFREGDELGLRLDAFADAPDQAWWRERGFELAEGDPYIDAETEEERVETGPPVKVPVRTADFGPLLLAALAEFYGLPPERELVATENGNPDDWPDAIPMITDRPLRSG